jgi:hypothetical protein
LKFVGKSFIGRSVSSMRVIFLTLPKPGEEKLQSKARWAREKRVLGKHFDVLSVGWASGDLMAASRT